MKLQDRRHLGHLGLTSGCCPDAHCAKVNVDASVSPHGRFGVVGAICRDNGGRLGNLFQVHHVPKTLEALEVREAMALSDDIFLLTKNPCGL